MLLAIIVILASCGGADQPTTTTGLIPQLTTLPPALAAPTTTVVVTTPPTTTAPPVTTTTLPPNAAPRFGITQVGFGEAAHVVIANRGNGPGTLEGMWLCQFPNCRRLPAGQLGPGESAVIGLTDASPPELAGIAVTVDLGPALGAIRPQSGALALYAERAFDDPAAVVSYVEWGSGGHQRSDVAIAAGIWTEGFVPVPVEAAAITSGVFPVSGPGDWFADVGG